MIRPPYDDDACDEELVAVGPFFGGSPSDGSGKAAQ